MFLLVIAGWLHTDKLHAIALILKVLIDKSVFVLGTRRAGRFRLLR